jgi:transketolase
MSSKRRNAGRWRWRTTDGHRCWPCLARTCRSCAWRRGEPLKAKGAYRLRAATAARKVVLIATGSEVEIALDVAEALEAQGIGADVVSMPCMELFDAQDAAYRADLLPRDALKVSIEAGVTLGWERYTSAAMA